MLKLKRAAAVAAGVAAVGLCAAPAVAATQAAPARVNLTGVTLRVAHTFVTPNQNDTLTATLFSSGGKPVAGATVYLVQRKLGASQFSAPVPVATPTDAKGNVTVTVAPGSTKGLVQEYGIVFNGDATYRGSRSGTVLIVIV